MRSRNSSARPLRPKSAMVRTRMRRTRSSSQSSSVVTPFVEMIDLQASSDPLNVQPPVTPRRLSGEVQSGKTSHKTPLSITKLKGEMSPTAAMKSFRFCLPPKPAAQGAEESEFSPVTEDMKNLYVCGIPPHIMDRSLLREHFSQFGRIIRMYLSNKRSSCTIHYETHAAAVSAKANGTKIEDSKCSIFWSQPTRRTPKSSEQIEHSEPETPKVSVSEGRNLRPNIRQREVRGDIQPKHRRPRSSSFYQSPSDRDKVRQILQTRKEKIAKILDFRKQKEEKYETEMFSYSSSGRGYEISDEVKDELKVMASSAEKSSSSDSETKFTTAKSSKPSRKTVLPVRATRRSSEKIPPKIPAKRKESDEIVIPAIPKPTTIKKSLAVPSTLTSETSLKTLIEKWNIKSKQAHSSPEDRYQLLELRDKILRMKQGRESDISKAKALKGTCRDMCPEKERYQRMSRHQVALYEFETSVHKEMTMDHSLAIKQYSRSSADQEEPLPHELRPPRVLRMTMDYILATVMNRCDNRDENLAEWYHFLWDRTRGVRKDITQQELCDIDAVNLIEECARFHIHCSERLVAEDTSVFDNKINSENLTKCLQTLKYMYHDMSGKGVKCQNEAEFRGYIILLNLSDGNFMWELSGLSLEIIHSEPVKFALEVFHALNANNYVRFFKLVKNTTYLNACILLRYFYQVRTKALYIILKSHCSGNKHSVLQVEELANLLGFESMRDAAVFCDHYSLELSEDNTEVVLHRDALQHPSVPLPVVRAVSLIESKRKYSVGEVVKGGPLSTETFVNYVPSSSFGEDCMLREEAFLDISALHDKKYKSKVLPSDVEQQAGKSEVVPTEARSKVEPKVVHGNNKSKVSATEEKQASDMAEKLRRQEQALEQAETVKSNEMMLDMLSEIIKEELQVFNERLMNVADLEWDELLLDVTCGITREVYKEVVAEELRVIKEQEEEAARKKEEEERKRAAAEREELATEKAAEIYKELEDETVDCMLEELCKEEERIHMESMQELDCLVNEIVTLESSSMLKESVKKARCKILAERRLKCDLRDYFNIWRDNVNEIIRRRKSMLDFPAWMSTMTLDEQVANLEEPQIIGEKIAKFEVPERTMDIMEKIPIFDIVCCELFVNVTREYATDKYFKMVVSLPDAEESPLYADFAKTYTETAFFSNEDPEALKKPLPLLVEKRSYSEHNLAVSVRRLVGPRMIEGVSPNPGAMAGASGVLFLLCHDSVSKLHTRQRLHNVVKAKWHYGGIPVAFLVTSFLEKEEMDSGLDIDSLMCDIGMSVGGVFHRKPKCSRGMEDMFLKGILWLAQNMNDIPYLYCTTAQNLLQKYLKDNLWERFEFHEASVDPVTKIRMDFNSAIEVQNMACTNLIKIVTDHVVLKCTIGAPEFKQFLPPVELDEYEPTTKYQVMPQNFGSLKYQSCICKLLDNAKLVQHTRQLPYSKRDLVTYIKALCRYNGIPQAGVREIWRAITFPDIVHNKAVTKSRWDLKLIPCIQILKVMFAYKARALENLDMMVAVDPEVMATFLEDQWLIYLSTRVPPGILAHRLNGRRKRRSSEEKHTHKKHRRSDVPLRRLHEERPIRLRQGPVVDMDLERCKSACENLSVWISECSRKQKDLTEALKKAITDDSSFIDGDIVESM